VLFRDGRGEGRGLAVALSAQAPDTAPAFARAD